MIYNNYECWAQMASGHKPSELISTDKKIGGIYNGKMGLYVHRR